MRTLRVEKGGKIILDNSIVDINNIENKQEFISGMMMLDVELSEDMTASDLIHFFYDSKDFIKSILSEEYEVVRALVSTANLPKNYKYIKVYKSFSIEHEVSETGEEGEYIYMLPEIELIPAEPGKEGIRTMSSLPVVIDENITLINKLEETQIKSKTKITLMDLMKCMFDELPSLIKEGLILSR